MGICHSTNNNKSKRRTDEALSPLSCHRTNVIETKSALPLTHKTFLRLSWYQISSEYQQEELIGSGAYGEVRRCVHIPTKQVRAIKRISKSKINTESFLSEFRILRSLDCPNIIKCYDFFEDHKNYYIVSELCKGGELFDRIASKNRISEQECAGYMRQILTALSYCHSVGVIHRDIKPENIFLDDDSTVKIGDFGSSMKVGSYAADFAGTPMFFAPEVIFNNGVSTDKADIWSCGIILYILFTGKMPYKSKDTMALLSEIAKSPLKPKFNEIKHISSQGRRFLFVLLREIPESRLSAAQALQDPWLNLPQDEGNSDNIVIDRIRVYQATNKMKEAVLIFLSHQVMTEKYSKKLTKTFQSADKNGDGKLSLLELKELLGYGQEEAKRVFDLIDTDKSGFIEFSEFLKVTIEQAQFANREILKYAFNQFDIDGNGYITADEIKLVLAGGSNSNDQVWEEIISEVDINQDGKIDFKEFLSMMQAI